VSDLPLWRRITAKRCLDLLVATLGLFLLSPVILACALAVRLTSPGPVLHLSARIGARNGRFRLIKFRTMKRETPQVATHLLEHAPSYLTPIGGVLRKSSLDELPQLINVIRGEMSLVGPRPALFNQTDQIRLRAASGCDDLTPGITGWAQVNGRDEVSVYEKVELDTWYLKHQTFWLDLKILWLTLWLVVSLRGVRH
jgi:O-antigen biosynthesis protein WbqP